MDCPTCGKSLNTQQGMRQHHAKVHDENLPNRTCLGCGTEFYDPKSRLEYCEDCYSEEGSNNGNFRDATEITTCKRCDEEFEYYPSDKDGVYCPDCVKAAEEFLGDHYADVHDIEPVERECKHCGEQFEVLPCHIRDGEGKFCSHDCLSRWLSEQWGDGEAVYNGDWRPVKRKALERDSYQCQACGRGTEEIGRNPDVHHIKPIREFDDPQKAHSLENVISLCPTCHGFAEHQKIPRTALRAVIESRN